MNKSKARGTAFETAVKQTLLDRGFDVRRMPPAGSKDVGDLQIVLANDHKVVLECKATRSIELAAAVDEANIERDNARAEFGFAIVKRRMKGVEKSYAVMELIDLISLLCIWDERNA